MNEYVVLYGKYGKGQIVKAKNTEDAITHVIEGDLFYLEDTKFPFNVYILKNPVSYMVSSTLSIKKIKL